jgi:hypothetical protein
VTPHVVSVHWHTWKVREINCTEKQANCITGTENQKTCVNRMCSGIHCQKKKVVDHKFVFRINLCTELHELVNKLRSKNSKGIV